MERDSYCCKHGHWPGLSWFAGFCIGNGKRL